MKVVISDNIKKVKQEKYKKTIKELRDELIELLDEDYTVDKGDAGVFWVDYRWVDYRGNIPDSASTDLKRAIEIHYESKTLIELSDKRLLKKMVRYGLKYRYDKLELNFYNNSKSLEKAKQMIKDSKLKVV